MILYRWRGTGTNFGDELNTVLWPRLLPGFFDEEPDLRFLGIGSVLDSRHPAAVRKIVAGSGFGGYERKPVLDDTWSVHWVRGPRTAAAVGLPRETGLGDPAMLVPHALAIPTGCERGKSIGFMPHFESAARGAWQTAAAAAGVTLIDPRDPPLDILAAIGRCKLLLSEALHGIIVADALRVPWVAVRPNARIHRAKWRDWADTVDVVPRFADVPPSTLAEWAGASTIGACHTARTWLHRQEHRLAGVAARRLAAGAARALGQASRAEPQLSADGALDRCQSRMLDAVTRLRLLPARPAVTRRSRLREPDDSAYELLTIG